MSKTEKKYNIGLGNRIKTLRCNASETQKDLGLILNKGESTVRMWELGKSEPDSETIKLIAHHYGVSTDFLLEQVHPTNSTEPSPKNSVVIFGRDGSIIKFDLSDDQIELVQRMIEQFDYGKENT